MKTGTMFPEHFFQASKLALSAPLLFSLILSLQNPGYCDLIKLKHGGEIRGKLQKLASGSGEVRIIETLTGGKIAVDSQQIEFITNRPLSVEEYESRSKSLSNTVEAHLELAEWCSENHLTSQRHAELEKVLLLEPDHAKTRAALGYTKRDGEWMTRDELMRKNGYIRYKGRYVSTAELELLEKNEAELAEERKWAKKIKLWLTFINSNNVQLQQEGLKNIQAINDPFAVAALARQMGKHENYLIRSLLVSTLSQITGDKPLRPLAELALSDPLQAIRESALQALSRRDVSQAIVYFIEALKNRSNMIVQRAGEGLKVIGDESVVPELIAALITTHTYRVRVPDTTTTYSFGTNGTFGNTGVVLPPDIEAGLLAGRYPNGVIVLPSQQTRVPMRTISVKHSHQNEAVLSALQEITQQNFGYNQRLWQLWWSSTQNKTGLVPVVQ